MAIFSLDSSLREDDVSCFDLQSRVSHVCSPSKSCHCLESAWRAHNVCGDAEVSRTSEEERCDVGVLGEVFARRRTHEAKAIGR